MALHRSVLKEDDILYELYADTNCDVSDNSDIESFDSDSDIPTTSYVNNCDLLPKFLLVTVKQVQKRKKLVTWRAQMIQHVTCGVWCKTDLKKQSDQPSLGTTGLNIVIDNP
jgi:hypothetical protein